MADCNLCELYQDTITVCNMTEPEPCDLMIVTDTPSYMADKSGIPMMDKGSLMLLQMLEARGITDYHCTYLVKCRPYDNAEPCKEDITTCMGEYFQKEYEAVKPKHILVLGNIALKALTKHSGIGTWRGQEIPYKDSIIIPTMSPAAVLKNPRHRPMFDSDISLLCDKVLGIERKIDNIQIHYVMNKDTLKSMLAAIKAIDFMTYDGEMTGFDYWDNGKKWLCMAIATDENTSWVIPLGHKQSPWRKNYHQIVALLKPFFDKKSAFKKKIGGWNVKFDDKWMMAKFGIDVNATEDGMLATFCWDENTPNGLKPVAQAYFKSGNYDKGVQFTDEYPLAKLMKYNGLDAIYTYRGIKMFVGNLKRTDPQQYKIYRKLLMPASKVFETIEKNGIYIVPENVEEARTICQKHIDEALLVLNEFVSEKYIAENLTKIKRSGPVVEPFNWNSPKQLANLFYISEFGLKLPILKETKTGAPSTDESTIFALREDYEADILDKLLDYRKWAKFMSTYIESWSGKVDENNRLHVSFKLHGTVTGRLSATDGIHQVPRDGFIRQLVGAPPGWTFLEGDMSQMELRLAAHESQDTVMIQTYLAGGDIHRGTAAEVTGKREEDVTKDDRKKAKAVNFGFVYGMGAKKFKLYAHDSYGVKVTIEEALKIRKKYFKRYKGLHAWHERRKRQARELGYVRYCDGRVRHLPDIYSSDPGVRAEAERQGVNSPIQGLGSDIVTFALIRFAKKVKGHEDEILITGTVHDAILTEVRNDKLAYWAPILKATMEEMQPLIDVFNCSISVPLVAELEYGQDWGHCQEWEEEVK